MFIYQIGAIFTMKEMLMEQCPFTFGKYHHCISFFFSSSSIPPTALAPGTRYEKMIETFGGTGYLVRTIPELQESLGKAMADTKRSSIINVIINPMAQRKTQVSQECAL